jgi:ATP-dependent protease ClpP protease subunit
MIKVKNLTDKGEIYLYGIIVDDTDANWLRRDDNGVIGYQYPADVKAQLDALKGKPIDVHIASDGGNVAAGVAIYNMLVNHDAPVTVYIDSWAASIASVIAFAGNKIVMPSNTFLMIHNPQGGAFGESDYLRSVADYLDKLRNMIADTYAKRAKDADVEKIKAYMDAETWWTAKEVSELFNDVELTDSNDIEAVAQYRSGYKTAPTALTVKDNTDVKNKIIKSLQEAYKL